MNSFGLLHFWQAADSIIKCIAILLLCLSLVSWFILVKKYLSFKQVSRSFDSVMTELAQAHCNQSVQIYKQHHLCDQYTLRAWLEQSLAPDLSKLHHQLQRGIPILASIGSTAPFIGLLGTVWGIYHAMIQMASQTAGSAQSAGLSQIAGPVGETLIMTAMGLVVAIPATVAYNSLVRQHSKLMANSHLWIGQVAMKLTLQTSKQQAA
jgi:biopolymer transport protein ExbB